MRTLAHGALILILVGCGAAPTVTPSAAPAASESPAVRPISPTPSSRPATPPSASATDPVSFQPTDRPKATATVPPPTAITPTPTPSPIVQASQMRITKIVPSTIVSLRDIGRENSVYRFANWGPLVAYVELNGPTSDLQQIKLLDLADPNPSPRMLEDGSKEGRQVTSPVMSATKVAWVSYAPRKAGGFAWQINAYDLASATKRTLVDGVNESRPGPDGVPQLALKDDLLVYETQAPTSSEPNAQAIHLLDIASGQEVQTYSAADPVWDIALSGSDILYSAGLGNDQDLFTKSETWFARADGTSVDLGPNGWEVAADGGRLVWVENASDATGNPATEFEVVMTAAISDPTARLVSHPYVQPGCPPECAIVGARWPAAGNGLVAWQEEDPSVDAYLVVWDPATDQRARLPIHGDSFVNRIGGGWLVTVTTPLDTPDVGESFVGMRVSDVLAAMDE